VRRKRNVWYLLKGLLVPCAAGAVLLWFAAALDGLQDGQEAEDIRQLEEALRRGCVACYAAEGIYPPSLEYLKDYYGIQVNEERYTVYYDAFAENLMPSITVLEN